MPPGTVNRATKRSVLAALAGLGVAVGMITGAPAVSSAGLVLEWNEPVTVSTPGLLAGWATVASSADGSRQAILWEQVESSRTRVWAAVSSDGGVTWDDSQALADPGQNSSYSDLAMTADGMNLVAGWRRYDGSNWRAQGTASSDGGLTWATPSTVSASGANVFVPDVAIAAQSTRRILAWERDESADVIQATVSDDTSTWGSVTNLSSGTDNADAVSVAISDDGQRIISAWSKFLNPFQIQTRLSTDGGANWGTIETFPAAVGASSSPQVAMSGTGQRIATSWLGYDGSVYRVQVRTSDDSATTWGPVSTLSEAGQAVTFRPSLSTSADGLVTAVAWGAQTGATHYTQVAVTTDGGATWNAPVTISTGSSDWIETEVSISQDGTRQVVVWSDQVGATYDSRLAYSLDSGATWSDPIDLSAPIGTPSDPKVAIAGDGSGFVVGYRVTGSPYAVEVRSARFVSAPAPPVPAPPVAATAPLDVTATGGDSSTAVAWSAPTSSGSFPVTNYQVSTTPRSTGCLVTSTTCVISGLMNGSEYEVRVRALTGAGWGAWSSPVTVVPDPPAPEPSIMITGSRDGGSVVVQGSTTGLVGAQVTPWVRFPGPGGYAPGEGVRTVAADGRFTWQRETNKKTYVYFRASDGVRSNRVVIAAR